MATGYSKTFLPLSDVTEKEFLSRTMGCKGVGFSYVRCKPGEGATYVHRHKVQEEVFIALKGDGTIILDGKRIKMPEGTIVRSVRRSGGRWATTPKKTLFTWYWERSRRRIFPWAAGRSWVTDSESKKNSALGKGLEESAA